MSHEVAATSLLDELNECDRIIYSEALQRTNIIMALWEDVEFKLQRCSELEFPDTNSLAVKLLFGPLDIPYTHLTKILDLFYQISKLKSVIFNRSVDMDIKYNHDENTIKFYSSKSVFGEYEMIEASVPVWFVTLGHEEFLEKLKNLIIEFNLNYKNSVSLRELKLKDSKL